MNNRSQVTMLAQAYRQLAAVQDRHWWFRHRQRLIRQGLDPLFPRAGERVLDLGCGMGESLALWSRYGRQVVAMDADGAALAHARQVYPEGLFLQGDGNQVGQLFQPGCFDLVAIMGVLYHQGIQQPGQVLAQVATLLKPGGVVVVTEAAFPFLQRDHDRQTMGARRFWPGEMAAWMAQANLQVVSLSCWNMMSFFPAVLLAAASRLMPHTGEGVNELALPPHWLNAALYALLTPEAWLMGRGWGLPLGVSLLVVARKPGGVSHRSTATGQDND